MHTPIFGLTWIAAQNDTEWRWLLAETAQTLAAKGPLSFRQLARELSNVAAMALVEREPRLAGALRPEDFQEIASAFARTQPQGWIAEAPLSTMVDALSETFLVAAAAFLAGMPSPWAARETEYWPFGNEGGFCNPMALKLLD